MDGIVHQHGHAATVTAAGAETAGERDLVLQAVVGDRFLHQLHDAVRALDMTGASNAYLNNHLTTVPFCGYGSLRGDEGNAAVSRASSDLKTSVCRLYLCHNLVLEECFYVCGGYGVEIVVEGNAYALLAFAHTESAAEGDLVCDVVFVDQALKLFYDLAGTFDVAGAADAYC